MAEKLVQIVKDEWVAKPNSKGLHRSTF